MEQLDLTFDEVIRQRRSERLILIVLAAVQFTSIVDFMVIMPLGEQLMQSLSIGETKFGLIVSSYTFAAGCAGIIASSIIDRFSRRTSFLLFYAGFLIGTMACALSPNYAALMVARLVTGGFGGILGGMSMAIIGDVFPEERRGRASAALTLGFALASVLGVPIGLSLGISYGWHVPFAMLAILGSPILLIARFALPPLNAHVGQEHPHPIKSLIDTFSVPNHLYAFGLMLTLMIGSFAVIPYVSVFLVQNVGYPEVRLPFVFITAGVLTLVIAPLVGYVADRWGKLFVYRVVVPFSVLMLIVVTHLPRVSMVTAIAAVSILMVSNASRMIAAMAMITSSVQRQRRGSFMSANASVQHIASGIGACFGGLIITEAADRALLNFGVVGWVAAVTTLASLWFAGRVQAVDDKPTGDAASSLAAAAEATFDVGEPMVGM